MKKKFDKAKQSANRLMVKLNPGRRSRSRSPNAPDTDANASTSAPSEGRYSYADPKAPRTAIGTAGSVVNEFLAAARDGADLCLPLKAVLVGAVKIFEICERTAEVSDQYNQLGSRLAHLGAVTGALHKRGHVDPNLMQRLENIAESFSRLAACIELKQERGTVRRVLESQGDVAEVKDILLKISARIEAFIYESMVRVEIGVDAILERLPSAEERDLEKALTKWSAITQVISSALGARRVHDAVHDAQPEEDGCMEGTRVGVLCKFIEWVKNDPKGIFWLAGMAGTGKTAIAVSLCRMLQEDPDVLLGGSFFCSRTSSDEARSDVRRIIPTLAALFADQSPKFAAELAAELKPSSGAAAHKPTSEQIGPLLQRPLAVLASETRPIVFVIDALDECSSEREMSTLLKAIATFACPARVKFILTSRPEIHILGSPISDGAQNEILQLHMIGSQDVTEDIRMYIKHAFDQRPLAGAEAWHSESDIHALTNLSNGLFIFASTAIAYILDTDTMDDRAARLNTVLSSMKDSKVATGPLDDVYEFVLTRASSETKVEPRELAKTRQVLACILTARMSLSIEALAELLGQKADVLRASLRRLRAVVHVPEDLDQPGLRTLHASFGDYMFERASPSIRIARTLGDDAFARGCLQVMDTRLHFNVSRSRSSYEPNPMTKPGSITLSLEYACLQWIYHNACLPDSSALDDVIHVVFFPRFLFWMEVMSVLNQVQRAAAMLVLAAATVKSIETSRFLRDANSFVISSRQAIERSAPHIYLSALPFSTKTSLIHKSFAQLYTGLTSVDLYGIDRHAGFLIMTLAGHEHDVNSVAYSPDGLFLGSGSTDGTIRIWNTRTGDEELPPLRSSDGAIYSVAFAPNGDSIASGTVSGAVYIWSLAVATAAPRKLSGHSGRVRSLAFSPDGSVLASASYDSTVRLCSTQTGQLQALLTGLAREGSTVTFSPDNQILACNSENNTIQVSRVAKEVIPIKSLRGHVGYIYSLSFSPDGTMLASGSADTDIILWNPRTGERIATLRGHSDLVACVQFAPNGLCLASAASDKTVRLWTLPGNTTDASSLVLGRHVDWVRSVAFSPDGMHVASGSNDHSIRIWDAVRDQSMTQPLPCHHDSVRSVALSADGTIIVSGSNDGSTRVWNVHTGEPKLPSLLDHKSAVLASTISLDGRLIASASRDCTIRLWNGLTGDLIGEPLRAHENWVYAVAFSPDTQWLASASEDTSVYVWDVELRKPSSFSPLSCISAALTVSFSPNGKIIAAGDLAGTIYLWHSDSGHLVCSPLSAHTKGIYSIDFAPDGARIVSGSDDATIRVWDTSTRQQVLVLEGHTGFVLAVAYSSDGRFIASGSTDKTVRLWNGATGESISLLHGHGEDVHSVKFTPDMRSIVSCSSDRTIRIWDIKAACAVLSVDALSPVGALASIGISDGWLVGPSGELLLWVPTDYRTYLNVTPCTILIGQHRVVINDDPRGVYAGERWTSCWGNSISNDGS